MIGKLQFLLLFFLGTVLHLHAQDFHRVTVGGGSSQTLRNNTVSVVSAGVTLISGQWGECNSNPYSIGLNYNGQSGSFTHTFSSPVTQIRLPTTATNIGELNTLYINGTKFVLKAAHVDSLKTCDTQYRLQNTASATGELVFTGPMVGSTYYGRFGSGTVNVYVRTGINSVRFENNGQMGGSVYGFFFKGVPLLARNNSDSLCVGENVQLYAEPEIPNGKYSWKGPDGFTANERNPIVNYSSDKSVGWYYATVITPFDTTVDSTYVQFLPIPEVKLGSNIALCLGDTLHIAATATQNGVSFVWKGPGNFTGTGSQIMIPHAGLQQAGVYSVTPKLGKCAGPVQRIRVDVYEPSFGATSTHFLCWGDSVRVNGKLYKTEGQYGDTIKGGNFRGCDSISTVNIIYKSPLDMGFVYEDSRVYCQGDSVSILGAGAATYSWRLNGLAVGSANPITIALPKISNLLVLEGGNDEGCVGKDSIWVMTKACCSLWMPNAFSPNNDGNNDLFGPATEMPIQQYVMKIYNRWGQVVFTSFDSSRKWAGNIGDKAAEVGTYFYTVKGRCFSDENIDDKGDFLLIR